MRKGPQTPARELCFLAQQRMTTAGVVITMRGAVNPDDAVLRVGKTRRAWPLKYHNLTVWIEVVITGVI